VSFSPPALVDFATAALTRAGMDEDKAAVVGELLVEADLMGHDTHGLNLLDRYVAELRKGTLSGHGSPEILKDRGAVAQWDGNWLSGVWLTVKALETAAEKAHRFGIGVVNIRRAHHTACLAAFLPRVTSQGLVAIIASSDPSPAAASVAAFGGLDRVLGPDPLAVGIPTDGDPILIDTSASITTNGMTGRIAAEGGRLPGQWVQDAAGNLSDDPSVLAADPPGTLLLTGGQDHGQKGYATALLVEALTHGLAGYGRRNAERRWTAAIFVQVIDPEAFAGIDDFGAETGFLAAACRASRPHPDFGAVRLPGQRALERKREAERHGLTLRADIVARLEKLADELGLPALS
jgi:LDH2 family malate/lactate/ureidoglycolate dehydrogenase